MILRSWLEVIIVNIGTLRRTLVAPRELVGRIDGLVFCLLVTRFLINENE